MKSITVKILASLLVLLSPALIYAQGCVGGVDPGCSPDVFCPCPVDNSVYLLIGAALLVFAKKSFSRSVKPAK